MREMEPRDGQVLLGADRHPEAASPAWITPELLQLTIDAWQPYYETRLSPDDAYAILTTVGRLFGVLNRD